MIDKATLVIRNGWIYTVDKLHSWAQAMAINRDKIVYVGTNKDAEKYIGPGTMIIDAKDRMVLPGFIDSHVHFTSGYMETSWVNLNSANSLENMYELITEHAEKHPDYRLIGGFGWRYEIAQSKGQLPRKNELDEIIYDRPVWLLSYDDWVGLANSKFTNLAEEALRGKTSILGSVERDPKTGEPTGVFYNPFDLIYIGGNISELIRENEIEGLKEIIGQATRFGITSIHEAQIDFHDLKSFQQVRNDGALNVRVYGALYYHQETTEEDLIRFKEAKSRYSDEWIKTGAIKLFIDGVLESHTAAMLEGYSDNPSLKGESKFTPEEFNEIVEKLDKMGFQCFVHACGDRGVRIALDAYENALRNNGRKDNRHRIEHIEIISDQDIPRFKQLEVIAAMQPEHVESSPDTTYYRAAGEDRMKKSFRWRSLLEAGAVLAFSSDWSVVDLNPIFGIHTALTRNCKHEKDQTITLEKAIEAYTINGAYASLDENIKGSIEVGKLADIIVLSDNLFKIPTERIKDVEVFLTIIGGKEVYRSDNFN